MWKSNQSNNFHSILLHPIAQLSSKYLGRIHHNILKNTHIIDFYNKPSIIRWFCRLAVIYYHHSIILYFRYIFHQIGTFCSCFFITNWFIHHQTGFQFLLEGMLSSNIPMNRNYKLAKRSAVSGFPRKRIARRTSSHLPIHLFNFY